MTRCIDCKFCRLEEDADEIVKFGKLSYRGFSRWHECDYNQKQFNEDKIHTEIDCKRFKER